MAQCCSHASFTVLGLGKVRARTRGYLRFSASNEQNSSTILPDEVISDKELEIIGSDGQKKLVENPLIAYTFHPTPSDFPDATKYWKETLRYPTPSWKDPEAKTNVTQLKAWVTSEFVFGTESSRSTQGTGRRAARGPIRRQHLRHAHSFANLGRV